MHGATVFIRRRVTSYAFCILFNHFILFHFPLPPSSSIAVMRETAMICKSPPFSMGRPRYREGDRCPLPPQSTVQVIFFKADFPSLSGAATYTSFGHVRVCVCVVHVCVVRLRLWSLVSGLCFCLNSSNSLFPSRPSRRRRCCT